MDNQCRDTNTIVITYANKIGDFEKEKENQSEDVTLLYGPYDGDKVITISMTELEVNYDFPMEFKSWSGIELSYTEIMDYLIIYARHNDLSYPSEGRITSAFSIDQQFDWFIQAIQNN